MPSNHHHHLSTLSCSILFTPIENNFERRNILQDTFHRWRAHTISIQETYRIISWKLNRAFSRSPFTFFLQNQNIWQDESLSQIFDLWRCYVLFRKHKHEHNHRQDLLSRLPPFLKNRYHCYFDQWLSRWNRKQQGIAKGHTILMKKYFYCWYQHASFLISLPQRIEEATLFFNHGILRTIMRSWKELCDRRGKEWRLAQQCFIYWKRFHAECRRAKQSYNTNIPTMKTSTVIVARNAAHKSPTLKHGDDPNDHQNDPKVNDTESDQISITKEKEIVHDINKSLNTNISSSNRFDETNVYNDSVEDKLNLTKYYENCYFDSLKTIFKEEREISQTKKTWETSIRSLYSNGHGARPDGDGASENGDTNLASQNSRLWIPRNAGLN